MSLLCKCMNSSCPNEHTDGKRNTQSSPPLPLPSPVVYDFLEENVGKRPVRQTPGTCETKEHTQTCLSDIAAMQMKGLVGPNLLWVCWCPPTTQEDIDARSVDALKFIANGFRHTDEQPAPVANDLPAVWGMVIRDAVDRDQLGRKRYGVPLQPHNGRDSLQDAYEAALDQVVYLRQAIYERDNPPHCECGHLWKLHAEGVCMWYHNWTFVRCPCTKSVPR